MKKKIFNVLLYNDRTFEHNSSWFVVMSLKFEYLSMMKVTDWALIDAWQMMVLNEVHYDLIDNWNEYHLEYYPTAYFQNFERREV